MSTSWHLGAQSVHFWHNNNVKNTMSLDKNAPSAPLCPHLLTYLLNTAAHSVKKKKVSPGGTLEQHWTSFLNVCVRVCGKQGSDNSQPTSPLSARLVHVLAPAETHEEIGFPLPGTTDKHPITQQDRMLLTQK